MSRKRKPALAKREQPRVASQLTILTVGHSTRSIDEFLEILRAHGIQRLVDVRTIPKSLRVPQFNSESLAASLRGQVIDYLHLKSLGGLRHPKKDSVNLGWRNASFRGYADYMATDEFRASLERLLQLAREKRTAIMCAEAVLYKGMSRETPSPRLGAERFFFFSRHSAQLIERAPTICEWSSSGILFVSSREAARHFFPPVVPFHGRDNAIRFLKRQA